MGSVNDDQDAVRSVAERIRRHVAERPNAADTANGVARWWFARADPPIDPAVVEAALESLVADGSFERVVLAGGVVVYRRR